MGMYRNILRFLPVSAQPWYGCAGFTKSQFGQFIQSICCLPKKFFSFSRSILLRDGSGLCGKASGCHQKLQLDLVLHARFRQAQPPDAHPPSRTPVSDPALAPAAIIDSPSDAPQTFISTPSLVERFTARCPVCEAAATKLCHLCGEPFCDAHLYPCSDCTLSLCGECMDSHDAEGHWGDSDTAREMFASITGGAR